jgi:RecB family exonuclease
MQEPVLGRNPAVVPISNSELGTFKDCRRKWWFGTYRGLQPKARKATGPLALGTRVHAALEAYYTDLQDPIEVYNGLVEDERFQLYALEQDTTDFDKESELGRVMIEGYLQWLEETGADAQLEVIGAEKKLSSTIMDGRVELIGKVDARVRRKTDGVVLSMDHKTVASFDSITKIAHLSEQPKMYHLL